MMSMMRLAIGVAGVAAWLLLLGFVIFAGLAMRAPETDSARADGIVVLTGGQTRIAEGVRLLRQGRGEKLLISGVNAKTTQKQLARLTGLSSRELACCVELGYAALDTFGNAEETRRWAGARNFDSLIVVTSSYHMPRSLAELARAMPEVTLISHPVLPESFRADPWWLQFRTIRILISEYLKFLPAAARLTVARLVHSLGPSSVAEKVPAPGAKT